MLEVARADETPGGTRMTALLELLYATGMRVSELVQLPLSAVARDQENLPVLLAHRYGAGQVIYALPVVEASMAEVSADRQARARWQRWYEGVLELI